MLRWIRRLRDWAMHDLWSMHRVGPQPQAVRFSYEKAGLTVHDQAIPWSAEAVRVEAVLRLPAGVARRKTDFQLRLPGPSVLAPESLRRHEADDQHRLVFRLPVPSRSVVAELYWRHHRFGQVSLPLLSCDEFIERVRLQMPTLFVRLGDQSVACQTYVSTQCRGLMTSAVLSSPTSLLPLMDLGLQVEFRAEREKGVVQRVPARLSVSQMVERETLVAVVPRGLPRHMGTWAVTWYLADRPLATQRVRAISNRQFLRSLRVADTRFIVQPVRGRVSLCRQLPPLGEVLRAGPCFLVTSREPGMAGVCPFQVFVQAQGDKSAPPLDQDVVISDGPTMVAPGTLDAADLRCVNGFELRLKGKPLGHLSTHPTPAAAFNAEGAFRPASEFTWSAAADDELNERLNRLLEDQGIPK